MEANQLEQLLLHLLPPEWASLLRLVAEVCFALSVLLKFLLRPFFHRYLPPGPLRSAVEWLDRQLEWFAFNSRPVGARVVLPRKTKAPTLPGFLLAVSAVCLMGCAMTPQQRARTAIDAVELVIEPAEAAALRGCGGTPTAACDRARLAFTTLRAMQAQAYELYNQGRFDEAMVVLKRLREALSAP